MPQGSPATVVWSARSPCRDWAGERDAFVAKLSPAGSALVHGSYVGGGLRDVSWGSADRDNPSALHVVGWTESEDFPVTEGAFQATFRGGHGDAFVVRLDF